MCTVVYIPTNESIIFASLRDESPSRSIAIKPKVYESIDNTFIAPKDTMAGGTWLGATKAGNVVILLNGAFEKHKHQPPYRKSRGLIVSELLSNKEVTKLWNKINLLEIEPFTLVVWENKKLIQLVWDGNEKHQLNLTSYAAQIWSSSTLYDRAAKEMRKYYFNKWILNETQFNNTSLFNFFNSVQDTKNGFLMNREDKVKTLSYTFIEFKNSNALHMDYIDLNTSVPIKESLLIQADSAII